MDDGGSNVNRNILAVGLILTSLLLVSGCGRGPKLVPAGGTVTMDGKPFADAQVTFNFTEHPRPASARTDSNGTFKLVYNNRAGAPIGPCKVMIRKQGKVEGGELFGELVPRRYNANTQLQYEITKEGPNEFTIPLTSQLDEADLQQGQGAPQPSAEESEDDEVDEQKSTPQNRRSRPQGNQRQPQPDDSGDEDE